MTDRDRDPIHDPIHDPTHDLIQDMEMSPLSSLCQLRTGLVKKRGDQGAKDQAPAFMITPSDLKFVSDIRLQALFLDGAHSEVIAQDDPTYSLSRVERLLKDQLLEPDEPLIYPPRHRSQPIAAGVQYRKLSVTWLSEYEIMKHTLVSGDLLLISKGQRPGVYLFRHPLDLDAPIPQEVGAGAHRGSLRYVAHSSFIVLRPQSIRGESVASWFEYKHSYSDVWSLNQSTAQFRIRVSDLSHFYLPRPLIDDSDRFAEAWRRVALSAVRVQLDAEIEQWKLRRDLDALLQGGSAVASLYNLSELRCEFGYHIARGDTRADEIALNLSAARLNPSDMDQFQIGLEIVRSSGVVQKLRSILKGPGGVEFSDFSEEFLSKLLILGSVRSIELSKGIEWGSKSALWHRLNELERVIDRSEFIDLKEEQLLPDLGMNDDHLSLSERVEEQLYEVTRLSELLSTAMRRHEFLVRELLSLN